jgi:DnaJ-class molecular chaperone
MTVCKKCQGKGAVKAAPYLSRRDLPCFWFAKGARTCPTCDGTGETGDGGQDVRAE